MAASIYLPCAHCTKQFLQKEKRQLYCSLSCSNSARKTTMNVKQINIQNYLLNPNLCKECNSIIPYEKKINLFCSRSCGAIYTNARKPKQSIINKQLQTIKAKKTIALKKFLFPVFKCYFRNCKQCHKLIIGPSKGLTRQHCSKPCSKKTISQKIKKYISSNPIHNLNRNPHKPSYMERSFRSWLESNGLEYSLHGYLFEVNFYNPITKKYGRADFVFPTKKLIIELDGTQHNEPKRKALDQTRDIYLESRGWKVIRITYSEYKKQSRTQEIKQLIL